MILSYTAIVCFLNIQLYSFSVYVRQELCSLLHFLLFTAFQRIHLNPRHYVAFLNTLVFYDNPPPNTQARTPSALLRLSKTIAAVSIWRPLTPSTMWQADVPWLTGIRFPSKHESSISYILTFIFFPTEHTLHLCYKEQSVYCWWK